MKIIIKTLEHEKIMHWVNKSDKEVSGFGRCKYDKDTNTFEITHAYLLKQEVGSAHTDIDEDAIADLMVDTRNDEGELKWWWH